jgi:hypothetical protein
MAIDGNCLLVFTPLNIDCIAIAIYLTGQVRRGLYLDDRDRVLASVKESVEEAGNKSEYSAYYFIIGVSLAVFAGLILIMTNIKSKQNQLEAYKQKIKEDVTAPLNQITSTQGQSKYIDSQITVLQTALSKRIDFAAFMKELSQKQYKNSRWTSFNLSSKIVSIRMEADSFDDMARSVKSFKEVRGVQEAKLSDVKVNPDNNSVAYTIDLVMDFNIYKIQEVK